MLQLYLPSELKVPSLGEYLSPRVANTIFIHVYVIYTMYRDKKSSLDFLSKLLG